MVELLKNMDFEVNFDWDEEVSKITTIRLIFENHSIERIA